MPQWFAAGFGALDLASQEGTESAYEIAVTPILPGHPVFLFGEGAAVWRRLMHGEPIDDATGGIARELEDMGLAVNDAEHPARIAELARPWLTSFTHELVYALLQNVATEAGIDLVFIKGPTLHAQGLRTREHSGDVDCWVRPGDDVRLAEAMRVWGWTPLFLPFTGTTVTHSLTLVAGDWGCAIDVHTSFPGMRVQPQQAFHSLHEAAEPRFFGGVLALTPPVHTHAVLSALHDMRPYNGQAPSESHIKNATAVLRTAGRGAMTVVDQFDAGYVLREPLERAFGEESIRFASSLPPADWSMRMEEASSRRHLRALRFVPARHRIRALRRLIWPTADTMRISLGDEHATSWSIFSARMRRVKQSIAKLIARR